MFGLFWLICTALLHFESDNGPSFVCTLCCLDSIMFKILKIFKPELWNKLVFVSSKVHVFNFYTHFTHTTYTMHTAAQEEPDGHRKIQPVCSHNYTRQWSAGANAMNKPAKKRWQFKCLQLAILDQDYTKYGSIQISDTTHLDRSHETFFHVSLLSLCQEILINAPCCPNH